MPKVTFDGKEYDYDSLSETAQANIGSLQFVKSEITRLQAQIAVYKTAERAYTLAIGENIGNQ